MTGTLAALIQAAPEAAGKLDLGVPAPHGWVGTTSQWIQGVGLIVGLLDLVLLVVIWRMIQRRGVTSQSKALLLGAIVVLPAVVVFLATAHAMQEAMTVEACGECHVMESHVADLRNPASDSLAAVHFKNRYIQTNQCYTCHSDYGMFGTLSAKLEGLGHVYHNTTGNYPKPIKIKSPYSNTRCLSCHGGAQNFMTKHEKEQIPSLTLSKESCLECHGPAHNAAEAAEPPKQAMR